MVGFFDKINDSMEKHKNNKQATFELSPACMIAKNIYDYTLQAPYFNEYLSQIAQMAGWDKVYGGHQHLYYLNDMILTINPDGKQTCTIPKVLESIYYANPKLICHEDDKNLLTTLKTNIKSSNVDESIDQISSTLSNQKMDEEFFDEDEEISLVSNLRYRLVRNVQISFNKFPPIDEYHFRERKVYRIYQNRDIIICFSILRPIECQKKFEDLLLPKPESKFTIKILIKNLSSIDKYIHPLV